MTDPSISATKGTQRLYLAGLFTVLGCVELVVGTIWLGAMFLAVAVLNLALGLRQRR